MFKAIQRLSEEGIICLERGSCIDELLTLQKPKDQSRNSPNVLKHKLEKSLLTPPTSLSTEWLDKLQECVPCLPTVASKLILGAGDGLSTLISLTFTNFSRPRPER